LVVGGLNTVLGLGLIFSAIALHFSPLTANLLGFSMMVALGFFTHAKFSFGYRGKRAAASVRFGVAVLVSYFANAVVLWAEISLLRLDPYLGQLPASATYVLVFYLANRLFVFPPAKWQSS
jgi:putative flippase GtrA